MMIFALLTVAVTLTHAALGGLIFPSRHTTPTQYGLTTRWDKSATANDDLWSDAVCRGGQFMDAFKGSDQQAGKIFKSTANPPTLRNQWQGDLQSDMTKWGWEETDAHDEFFCSFGTFWKYDTPYDALGLNKKPRKDGGDNLCYEHWHGDDSLNADHKVPFVEQSYKVNDQEYSKTGAWHKCAINQVGGVITTQYRLSPLHAAKRNWGWDPHRTELPALRSSADILWGLWYRDNPNIKNVRYFWCQNIVNPQTTSIIASSLKMWGKEVTGWPGVTFSMEDDEGLALLGSPNAISFGYFLISHKQELGNKKITKAQVFWGNENDKNPTDKRHPDMLFYVEDVPEETEGRSRRQQGVQRP